MPFSALRLSRRCFLVASAALCAVSLISCQPAPESPTTPPAPAITAGTPTLHSTISKSVLTRDYGNARLSFVLEYTNTSDETVYLSPPFLQLLTPSGDLVAPLLLPSEKVQEIRSGKTGVVQLRYWLDPKHFDQALILHLGETQQIEIKSAQAFDLKQLENGKEHELKSVNW